jgi:ATP-dependent helicase HrpA
MQASTVPALAVALPSFEVLRTQLVHAVIDRTCLIEPWPQDAASFLQRQTEARAKLSLLAQELARLLTTIVQEAAAATKKMVAVRAFPAVVLDVEQQLQRLFERNFLLSTPAAQLPHYPRYLKAISLRLEKFKTDPARDAQRLAELTPLQNQLGRVFAQRKGVADPRLTECRWLLEELRVALFAQELRTPMPVSVKRLQKLWAGLV